MPETVILTKLQAKQRATKVKVPDKSDPTQTIEVSAQAPTLHISLVGSGKADMGEEIRAFRERLRDSDVLKTKLEDIRVSTEEESVNGRKVVSYDIDCIFKPQI